MVYISYSLIRPIKLYCSVYNFMWFSHKMASVFFIRSLVFGQQVCISGIMVYRIPAYDDDGTTYNSTQSDMNFNIKHNNLLLPVI